MTSRCPHARGVAAIGVSLAVASSAVLAAQPAPHAEKVLRIVPSSNLVILDPVWSTAYITRNHGYMIYDTLFGKDADGRIAPQMVDKYEMSADRKTWSFTLRDGLEFHDGAPVTSEDVIASLRRWGARDSMGSKLLSFTDALEAVSARTFRIRLREPYGLVLESLAKPGAALIKPKRVADTPADKQISDYIGSGPFVFKKDEWRPGEKVVYVKNKRYVPRAERASGTAGGKVVNVDRVEWIVIKDPQTQVNALLAGEVDLIEVPAHESYASFKKDPGIRLVHVNRLGSQVRLRFNHLQPPFDNAKVRQAAMAALNQPAFLQAQVGIQEMYRTCFSVYPCDGPLATTKGMDFIARPDMARARRLLEESGYQGIPVVILQPTDLSVLVKLPVVAAQLLRQAGFKVELQSMDWQTMVARLVKKDPPSRGGWNLYVAVSGLFDAADPISNVSLNAACDQAPLLTGWACDERLEKLRDSYARAQTDPDRKAIAEQVQVRAMEVGTHVPLGELRYPAAVRSNVKNVLTGYFFAAWNLELE